MHCTTPHDGEWGGGREQIEVDPVIALVIRQGSEQRVTLVEVVTEGKWPR
jgi:hypothetical protein